VTALRTPPTGRASSRPELPRRVHGVATTDRLTLNPDGLINIGGRDAMTSVLKRYVPTVALLILLSLMVSTVWLAIPAIILIVQVVSDRPGRLLRAVTGRGSALHR
jgi:hypothetical protein